MVRCREPGEDDLEQPDLSSFDRDFAAVSTEDIKRSVPDGRYLVQVEQVELTTARASLRPILKWKMRILSPPFTGRRLFKNHGLSTIDNLRWLKHDLGLCGLCLEKLSDLPYQLDRLSEIEIEVTKRTRGEWENIYFEHSFDPRPGDRPNKPPF